MRNDGMSLVHISIDIYTNKTLATMNYQHVSNHCWYNCMPLISLVSMVVIHKLFDDQN